jgi:mannose-6-phosphate isomerase-like protein (cupin superfamily)
MKGLFQILKKILWKIKIFAKFYILEKQSVGFNVYFSQKEIGEEVHTLDQFFRIESGTGLVVIDGVSTEISDGSAIIVPAGANHNVINISDTDDLKLYTIYSPPEHIDQRVHVTKDEAMADVEDEFDGKTTE